MANFFFRKKFSQMSDKLYRVALWMLSEKQDAEDVVQDVFLKLSQLNNVDVENVEAYAVRATKNLCLDRLKRKKFVNKSVEVENLNIATKSLEKEYDDKEAMNETKRAIDRLPEMQRMVLELRHIEGYTIREISQSLEIEENYARVLISRARKQLTEDLSKTEL